MSKYYVLAIPQFNLPIRYNRLLSATNIPFTTNVKEHNFKKLVPTKWTTDKKQGLTTEYPATRTNFFVAGYAVHRNLLIQVEVYNKIMRLTIIMPKTLKKNQGT